MNMTTSDLAPFWDHVEALRSTLVKIIIIISLGTALSFFFHSSIISFLTRPLNNSNSVATNLIIEERIEYIHVKNDSNQAQMYRFPENFIEVVNGNSNIEVLKDNTYKILPFASLTYSKRIDQKLIVLGPIDGMVIALKTSLWVGVLLTSPLWLYALMQFFSPALHENEMKLLLPFLGFSLLLMCLGGIFAYTITIPIANLYLSSFNQSIGINLWSLEHYLDYTFFLIFANSLAFELFVIGVFGVHLGIITAEGLKSQRRIAILGTFVIGAILTPPDVLTQLMLAIPLILLYELLIIYASIKSTKLIT